VDPRLQRRLQRCGWDLAAVAYAALWQAQLSPMHARVMASAALVPGEAVLDVACGTGIVSLAAAAAVGPNGSVVGVDLSSRMVDNARQHARDRHVRHATFARMDAQALELPDASVDVVLCALGLMYLPDPVAALREMRRVLRPGGRAVMAVWGERSRCGWSRLFAIVNAEVECEVCPRFFRLGRRDTLARSCADARFDVVAQHRIATSLDYRDADDACNAALVGGPVALAWSRFDDHVRRRVRRRYLDAIAAWKRGRAYKIPGEFVVVDATAPASPAHA
jgi:ubiquinone/menaquinone biosynthesis C-methylase UbiE